MSSLREVEVIREGDELLRSITIFGMGVLTTIILTSLFETDPAYKLEAAAGGCVVVTDLRTSEEAVTCDFTPLKGKKLRNDHP